MKVYSLKDEIFVEVELHNNFENDNYYFIISNPEELNKINERFNLRFETIEECNNKKHDTKIEVFPDYNFCTFNEIEIMKNKILIEELNIYYSRNYIICVSKADSKIINKIQNLLKTKNNNLLLNTSNPCSKILYLILDNLFLSYFDTIIQLEKRVEVFEEEVLNNRIKHFLNDFIDIRRQLLRIIRYISPVVYLIDLIKLNENNIISDEMMRYFENIEIKFNKLDSNILSLRESVAYLREAYEAEVANQTNNIMKIFTIVSAIFLPLTLLTGIFGMNFENMPLVQNYNGFYQLVFIMLFIASVLVIMFKRRKWM